MLPYGRKNPLPFLYSLSSPITTVPSKGKGEIYKRVENRSFSKADFSQLREMFSIVKEMSFSASNSADNGRF